MYQRQLCPSMGAIRLPWAADIATLPRRSARAFHMSARRPEDDKSDDAIPKATGSFPVRPDLSEERQTRRARSTSAFTAVRYLGQNPTSSATTSSPSNTIQLTRPLIRREMTGSFPSSSTGRAAPPPGTMVRAPAALRITRNAPSSTTPRGPNLRGRAGPSSSSTSGGNNRGEQRPKKRERKAGGAGAGPKKNKEDVSIEDTLSDGMVQQLYRLQRKEWDKVPYEPKYKHGSSEARELVETGKLLFAGEVPKVKSRQELMLERRIGIVGMHGT
ncbi:hypothetical protein P154DRAFT_620967 [Amniculicola lignicola CBS 123094]|uniref:Uncharacterized protein n=1 Tax=Amniculicola lignicola CBS 123094 TaxID=1392246 RepID=A0A6A5WDN4_9PLEO|nr:hypothetical protein P154DRAFT_620967 [Amniculicola lignicola CBS 123094]